MRILQTKLASELKINRSIREATDAMDRYNDEQAKREATGSSTYIRIGNDDHALKSGLNALARLNLQKTDEIARLEAEREIMKDVSATSGYTPI